MWALNSAIRRNYLYRTNCQKLFIRGIRVKSPIVDSKQTTPGNNKGLMNLRKLQEDNEDEKEIDKEIVNLVISQEEKEVSKQKTYSKTSVFSPENIAKKEGRTLGITKLPKVFESKSPELIEKELKEQFEKDGVEYDARFVKRMIEEAEFEQGTLERLLHDDQSADQLTQDELTSFLDWVITDSYEKLEYLKEKQLDETSIDDHINNLTNSDYSSNDALLQTADTLSHISREYKSNGLQALPTVLESLINDQTLKKFVSIEYMIQFFEISTQIPDNELSNRCIFLAGNLLYSSTNKRLDPINESFYIEALLLNSKYNKAVSLFQSRYDKSEDIRKERFWLELGIKCNLSKLTVEMSKDKSYSKCLELIELTKEKFNYIHPSVCILIISNFLSIGKTNEAYKIWLFMKENIMDQIGLIDYIPVPEGNLLNDKNYVYDYYNRIDAITFDNLKEIIIEFLKNGDIFEALTIIETGTKRDKEFMKFFLNKLIEDIPYPIRELVIHKLENENVSQKLHPSVVRILLKQLYNFRESSTRSELEANILNETYEALKARLISLTDLNNKIMKSASSLNNTLLKEKDTDGTHNNTKKTKDLLEMKRQQIQLKEVKYQELYLKCAEITSKIESGIELTSLDCRDILKFLTIHRLSRKNLQLAYKVLAEMNTSLNNNNSDGFFPGSNAHHYTVLATVFGRMKQSKTRELFELISFMQNNNIDMNSHFANQVLLSFRRHKNYSKAFQFIEDYISVNDTTIEPNTQLYTTILSIFNQSLISRRFKRENVRNYHNLPKWLNEELDPSDLKDKYKEINNINQYDLSNLEQFNSIQQDLLKENLEKSEKYLTNDKLKLEEPPLSKKEKNLESSTESSTKSQVVKEENDKFIFMDRFSELRSIFLNMIQKDQHWQINNKFIREALYAFINFEDETSIICVLQYIGLNKKLRLTPATIMMLQLSFDSCIQKLEFNSNNLLPFNITNIENNNLMKRKIEAYKLEIDNFIKGKQYQNQFDWKDGVFIITKFMEVLNFPDSAHNLMKHNNWAMLPQEGVERRKKVFLNQLYLTQEFYGLQPIGLNGIVDGYQMDFLGDDFFL